MDLYKKILLLIVLVCLLIPRAAKSQIDIENDNHTNTPWFTGPLLAPSGITVAQGKQNYEPYLFATDNVGFYNYSGRLIHATSNQTIEPIMLFWQGLTRFMDIEFSIPYHFNSKLNQHSAHIADSTIYLGFQVLRENSYSWLPDLRLTVQETFPTGRYQNLNPSKLMTDATGAGSFQSGVSLNFQKLISVYNHHYFRTRLSITYTVPANVRLHNFNAYGGGFATDVKLNPGNHFKIDLAFEYTLTQNWVYAIDLLYINTQRGKISGFRGFTSNNSIASVSQGSADEFSFAPALEYNFNAKCGIVTGIWFSVSGRDIFDFISGVIALNYYT